MNALARAQREGGLSRVVPIIILLALGMQVVLGTEPNAFAWSAASAAVVLVTLFYCFRPGVMGRFPLSTIAIVGFDSVTLGIPLVGQSATGRSFLYNLTAPEQTFVWIYLTHAVLIGTHAAYTALSGLQKPGQLLARRVFLPISVFRTPTQAELWILGFIGLAATFYTQVTVVNTVEYGDVGSKTIAGFAFFSVFPFLIPFRRLFSGGEGLVSRFSLPALAAYFGVVIIIALATNKRLTFSFIGLTLIVLVILFSGVGRLRMSGRAKLIAVAVILASTPVFGFFENLTTAMEMVRGAKGSLSGAGYISATIDQLGDQDSIDRWERNNQEQAAGALDYSEDYINITLLNRFVFLKYTDLTMTASEYFGDPQRTLLKQDFVSRLEQQLPTPIAQALGLYVDKLANEHSAGDVYQSVASRGDVASYLTGSSVTYSRDVLERYWLPGMVLIFLLIFNAFDALSLFVKGRLVIAPCAMLFIFQLFLHGCIDDSLADLIGGATRGLLQSVMLYVVVVSAIRVLLSLVAPASTPARTSRAAIP